MKDVFLLIGALTLYLRIFGKSWNLVIFSRKTPDTDYLRFQNPISCEFSGLCGMNMKMCWTLIPLGSLGNVTLLCPLRWPCLHCSWAVPPSCLRSPWSVRWRPGLPPTLWLHKSSISWEWKCHIYLDHSDSFTWAFHMSLFVYFGSAFHKVEFGEF